MDKELNSFLKHILEIIEGLESAVDSDHLSCLKCGSTYGCFRKTGKMGCADCYIAFRTQIAEALKNIHSTNIHTGKIPVSNDERFVELITKRELAENRIMLERAIETENYEDAAKYRDIINDIMSKTEVAR